MSEEWRRKGSQPKQLRKEIKQCLWCFERQESSTSGGSCVLRKKWASGLQLGRLTVSRSIQTITELPVSLKAEQILSFVNYQRKYITKTLFCFLFNIKIDFPLWKSLGTMNSLVTSIILLCCWQSSIPHFKFIILYYCFLSLFPSWSNLQYIFTTYQQIIGIL